MKLWSYHSHRPTQRPWLSLCIVVVINVFLGRRLCHAQTVCSSLSELAALLITIPDGGCNCRVQPVCGTCSEQVDSTSVTCASSCGYCDTSKTNCGGYGYTAGIIEFVDQGETYIIPSISYTFVYTKGSRADVTLFLFGLAPDQVCSVKVGTQTCNSCTMKKCTDGTYQPTIDCTNIEKSATATACSRPLAGGLTSINAAAQQTSLLGLVLPYLGCKNGFGILESAPARPPQQAPQKPAPRRAPQRAPQRPAPRAPVRRPQGAPVRRPQGGLSFPQRSSGSGVVRSAPVSDIIASYDWKGTTMQLSKELPPGFDPKMFAYPVSNTTYSIMLP